MPQSEMPIGPEDQLPDLPSSRKPASVYERLKRGVLSGELEPGRPMVETALADWCKVSRTPVREALNRLEHDGLVIRTSRGLVVKEVSPEEILDLYETRIALEATAARLAADRRTARDLIKMRQLAKRMHEVNIDDAQEKWRSNDEYHRSIWAASHNGSLIDLLERLSLHLRRHQPSPTLSFPGRWEKSIDEHAELIDAIEARDVDLAHRLASAHFIAARDLRLEIWADGDA